MWSHFKITRKKTGFHLKPDYFFMHGKVFKDRSRNSAMFKMKLFATIGNGWKLQRPSSDVFTTNEHYFYVAAVTQQSLQAKSKLDENNHDLKVASDTLSCFGDTVYFSKKANFCLTNILLQFENQLQKWKLVSLLISSSGSLLKEPTINMCSEKCCQ